MAEDVGSLVVRVAMDNSNFQQGIQNLNRSMKIIQSEFKNATSGLKDHGKGLETLKDKQEMLSKTLDVQVQIVNKYKGKISESKIALENNAKAHAELKAKVDNVKKAWEDSKKELGENATKTKELKETYDKLNKQYDSSEEKIRNNVRAIDNYTTKVNNSESKLKSIKRELNSVNSSIDKQENKWNKLSRKLDGVGNKFKELSSKMGSVGKEMTTKITVPIIGLGTLATKASLDFKDSIAKVGTIADTAQIPISKLRGGILKLIDDTGIESSEIANNVYDAISAGQKTGDAVNFVNNSTKLAKAGFAEAGQSLDVLTTIMNSYKLKAQDVTKVSDYLITTQNEGKVTVGELSSVMGKVIPTAVATSTGLNQVTAGYALMTKNDIKAAETTTYMNSMLNEMSKTGTTADKAIRKMTGKSFSELMKSGKSVSDVLNTMNTYARKNKLSLKDMFGSAEAGKAALVLSTNAGKNFIEMLDKMNKSTGSTDKAFDKL